MLGEVGVGGVGVGLEAMRPGDRGAQIVGHHDLGDAGEEVQRPHVRGAPVGERLGPGRLGEGVVRCPEDCDEDLCVTQFPGGAVDDGHAVAGVVDEQLLAGAVGLAHHHVEAPTPRSVAFAELAVLKPLGVDGLVLVPQQREGDALAPALSVHAGPVRNRAFVSSRHRGGGEQPPFERALVELFGQRPGQPGGLGSVNVLTHCGGRGLDGARDGPDRQSSLEEQPQYAMDFAHG